ncbi:MAG: hypothetical protein M3N46_10015 [Actinomycetota bacterium]|nr:hypothetical protein [Actinomycetota bacterium]
MELTITDTAERLGITRRAVTYLLDDSSITGRRLSNGTWLLDADSVSRWEHIGQRGKGRPLNTATAWAILWELSGLDAEWLERTTRFRLRDRIRSSDALGLARAVAKRTVAHRYRAANAERAADGLIATGRAAAHATEMGLIRDRSRVAGYIREGTADAWADSHFMLSDSNGQDVIYDNTLPIRYDADEMPSAVVAADLARSTDTRERSAALRALEQMRQTWLAAN